MLLGKSMTYYTPHVTVHFVIPWWRFRPRSILKLNLRNLASKQIEGGIVSNLLWMKWEVPGYQMVRARLMSPLKLIQHGMLSILLCCSFVWPRKYLFCTQYYPHLRTQVVKWSSFSSQSRNSFTVSIICMRCIFDIEGAQLSFGYQFVGKFHSSFFGREIVRPPSDIADISESTFHITR